MQHSISFTAPLFTFLVVLPEPVVFPQTPSGSFGTSSRYPFFHSVNVTDISLIHSTLAFRIATLTSPERRSGHLPRTPVLSNSGSRRQSREREFPDVPTWCLFLTRYVYTTTSWRIIQFGRCIQRHTNHKWRALHLLDLERTHSCASFYATVAVSSICTPWHTTFHVYLVQKTPPKCQFFLVDLFKVGPR